MLRDCIGIIENRARKCVMHKLNRSDNRQERSGINKNNHEQTKLYNKNDMKKTTTTELDHERERAKQIAKAMTSNEKAQLQEAKNKRRMNKDARQHKTKYTYCEYTDVNKTVQ